MDYRINWLISVENGNGIDDICYFVVCRREVLETFPGFRLWSLMTRELL